MIHGNGTKNRQTESGEAARLWLRDRRTLHGAWGGTQTCMIFGPCSSVIYNTTWQSLVHICVNFI
jgi:hypothetical protein